MSRVPSGCAALQIKYRQSSGLIFSGKIRMDAGVITRPKKGIPSDYGERNADEYTFFSVANRYR